MQQEFKRQFGRGECQITLREEQKPENNRTDKRSSKLVDKEKKSGDKDKI